MIHQWCSRPTPPQLNKTFVFVVFSMFYVRPGQQSTVSYERLANLCRQKTDLSPWQVSCCLQQRSRQCAEIPEVKCVSLFYNISSWSRPCPRCQINSIGPVVNRFLRKYSFRFTVQTSFVLKVRLRFTFGKILRFGSVPCKALVISHWNENVLDISNCI
jgi:hypothetical protein